jgi:excisionase family DNA binding protein
MLSKGEGCVSFVSPIASVSSVGYDSFMSSHLLSTAVALNETDVQRAQQSLSVLRGVVDSFDSPSLELLVNGRPCALPEALKRILKVGIEYIAEKHPVALIAADDEIGTQEAADLLGVSRPYLVKLLDHGVISSRKVGVQRRTKVSDVLEYKEREKEARRRTLVKLAEEDQRLNIE